MTAGWIKPLTFPVSGASYALKSRNVLVSMGKVSANLRIIVETNFAKLSIVQKLILPSPTWNIFPEYLPNRLHYIISSALVENF